MSMIIPLLKGSGISLVRGLKVRHTYVTVRISESAIVVRFNNWIRHVFMKKITKCDPLFHMCIIDQLSVIHLKLS